MKSLLMVLVLAFQSNSAYAQSAVPLIVKNHLKIMVIDSGVSSHTKINHWIKNVKDSNDNMGHGTHVTGIILLGKIGYSADNPNEPTSFDPVCNEVEIVPCKVFDPKFSETVSISKLLSCVDKATRDGIDVINFSGEEPQYDEKEFKAWKRFTDSGGIVVAAAGNHRLNLLHQPSYPAAFAVKGRPKHYLSRMYAVANMKDPGKLSYLSNYYPGMIGELGEDVLSTAANDPYGKNEYTILSGTSQAAPMFTHRIAKKFCANLR